MYGDTQRGSNLTQTDHSEAEESEDLHDERLKSARYNSSGLLLIRLELNGISEECIQLDTLTVEEKELISISHTFSFT